VAALTEALKELAAHSGLESKVAFCPRLELFVESNLQKDNETFLETNEGARAHGREKRGGEIEHSMSG